MHRDLIGLVEDCLRATAQKFFETPGMFFNEHEFHGYCFHRFYRQPQFTKTYPTSDGVKTILLHPEYPTIERFCRKTVSLDPKGRRARYDLAILNPDFVQANTFKTVANRDIKACSGATGSLIAAVEFKYITKHGSHFQHEIAFDMFKLRCAREADRKYFVVFATTRERESDYFAKVNQANDLTIIYLAVHERNGRKLAERLDVNGYIAGMPGR